MDNLFCYIEKYRDINFNDKDITEIDILIFSQIPVWRFKNLLTKYNDGIKISYLWELSKKDIDKDVYKRTYKIMENICSAKRYKDIIIKNYQYYCSNDTQFGAFTLVLPNNYICVVYQGTDDTIGSWKDNFKLSYEYPTISQNMAIEYLNNTIDSDNSKVIVCGHSKGGNLALVSSMNINYNLNKIYSFDGPGLRCEEFKSIKYKLIKSKLVNIVPESSCVGVILEQENVKFVKSNGSALVQHDSLNWCVNDDEFLITNQSNVSKKIDLLINKWFSKLDYEERKEKFNQIYDMFDNLGISKFSDIKEKKIENIYKLISSYKHISIDIKRLVLNIVKILIIDYVKNKEKFSGRFYLMDKYEKLMIERTKTKNSIERMKRERRLHTFIWWCSPDCGYGMDAIAGPAQILCYIVLLVSLGLFITGNLSGEFLHCAGLYSICTGGLAVAISRFAYKNYYNNEELELNKAKLNYIDASLASMSLDKGKEKNISNNEKSNNVIQNKKELVDSQSQEFELLRVKSEKLNLVLLKRLLQKAKKEYVTHEYESLIQELGPEYQPILDDLLSKIEKNDDKVMRK